MPRTANSRRRCASCGPRSRPSRSTSGQRFSEEARKIHYEETPARGIYGEATRDEARALSEEGIEFFPLPILPEDQN